MMASQPAHVLCAVVAGLQGEGGWLYIKIHTLCKQTELISEVNLE